MQRRNRLRTENYKIYEYTDGTIIEPVDDKHDFTMIFFSGFNENASKYLFLFKSFFEDYDYKIRIVIPNMPIYTVSRENITPFMSIKNKSQSFFSWYDFSINDGNIKIVYNEEKDNFIVNLIEKEIKKLKGNSEKLIFAGFSQGGRYGLHILTKMKLKVAFFVLFKSMIYSYENPFLEGDPTAISFMQNNFHLYISLNDKIINLPNSFRTIDTFRKSMFKFTIKVDNGKKHAVDEHCLIYLENLLYKYIMNDFKPKF